MKFWSRVKRALRNAFYIEPATPPPKPPVLPHSSDIERHAREYAAMPVPERQSNWDPLGYRTAPSDHELDDAEEFWKKYLELTEGGE